MQPCTQSLLHLPDPCTLSPEKSGATIHLCKLSKLNCLICKMERELFVAFHFKEIYVCPNLGPFVHPVHQQSPNHVPDAVLGRWQYTACEKCIPNPLPTAEAYTHILGRVRLQQRLKISHSFLHSFIPSFLQYSPLNTYICQMLSGID